MSLTLECNDTLLPDGVQSTPLGEQLLHAGLLNTDELQSALAEQQSRGQRLGEVLAEMGFVEEEDLLPFLAERLGVPAVRIREGLIDPRVVQLLPRKKAEAFHALALFRVRDELTVAIADPQNLNTVDEMSRITGLRIRPVLAIRSAIAKLLPRCYEEDFSVDTVTADIDSDAVELHPDAIDVDLQSVQSLADGSPVINLVNYIIVHAGARACE